MNAFSHKNKLRYESNTKVPGIQHIRSRALWQRCVQQRNVRVKKNWAQGEKGKVSERQRGQFPPNMLGLGFRETASECAHL